MVLVATLAPALVLAGIGVGLLIFTAPASATPTYVNSWSAGSSTTVSSIAVTVATSAGDTVVVMVGTKINTCTVSGVTDNGAGGGSTYASKATNYNTIGFAIFGTAVSASVSATSVTVSLTGAGSPCKVAVAVGEYSGATNYGNTITCSGSGANPGPCTLTVQETNGGMVGGFATSDGTAQTALTGNLRQAPVATGGSGSTRVGSSLVDLLSQTAGSHSIATTHAAIVWRGAAVELRNEGTLISVSCTSGPTPLTMNRTFYVLGVTNYVRLTCTADGKAYTTSGGIAATPTFTLPAPFTELWSFQSSTGTGTTCAGGTGAWQMASGSQHTFPSASTSWDYCALIPSTATADSTTFTVAWSNP